MTDRNQLIKHTRRDIQRLKLKAQKHFSKLGLVLYGGTLGLLFVVPLVGGAYLGRWLDSLVEGYSVRWTVSLIVLGIALGAYNVFFFLRDRP